MRIDLIHDSGGYREEETPCPISNQEAKLFIADNTLSYWDGNVGRCQFRDSFFNLPLFSIPYPKYQKQYKSSERSFLYIYSSLTIIQTLIISYVYIVYANLTHSYWYRCWNRSNWRIYSKEIINTYKQLYERNYIF